MKIVLPEPDGFALAAEAIRAGEIVAYPTETVYGLAVDPFSETAVEKLFHAKGRDSASPILLVVADEAQLKHVAAAISSNARRYMETFWPGPLSLLFPKAQRIVASLTHGNEKIGVRCPSCPTARLLCLSVGHAVTSTSANRSGMPAARSVDEIDVPDVAIAIDGGRLESEFPSTVFDPDLRIVHREGAISAKQLLVAVDTED